MRDFLNGILSFIVASSLTDDEFATVKSTLPILDQSTYDDLTAILISRGSASNFSARLTSYYTAKGVTVTEVKTAKSNIFIGGVL